MFWKLNEHLRTAFVAPARQRSHDTGERARIDRHDPAKIDPHHQRGRQDGAGRLVQALGGSRREQAGDVHGCARSVRLDRHTKQLHDGILLSTPEIRRPRSRARQGAVTRP
jgi:hypothetical protein